MTNDIPEKILLKKSLDEVIKEAQESENTKSEVDKYKPNKTDLPIYNANGEHVGYVDLINDPVSELSDEEIANLSEADYAVFYLTPPKKPVETKDLDLNLVKDYD